MAKPGLVAEPIVQARTRHKLAPSKISEPLLWAGRFVMPAYLRLVLCFQSAEVLKPERLVEPARSFQQGHARLIVAFRHPYGDEAQLMFHVFENLLPRAARKLGTPLARRLHLRTVHDYAVPLWSDALVRYLLPRAGALPVYHIKFDADSLSDIRAVLRDSPCPLGLAPEGQISYHSDTLPRIEQGTVRMGFWCARDMARAGRDEPVLVLPLSVHYRYALRDARKVTAVLARLETICGLPAGDRRVPKGPLTALLPRVDALECRLLTMTEAFYAATYAYPLPADAAETLPDGAARHARWSALLLFALDVAERALGIDPGASDLVQRMYRMRLECWDRIYPEVPVEALSPLEAAFAHRRTGEAWYAMRHMELVDLMGYHDPEYLTAACPAERFYDRLVESVTTLEDLASRLMGGNIVNRPNRIRKRAYVVPGPCLNLSERLPEYRADARKAAAALTDELSRAFLECIKEYENDGH